MNKVIQGDCLIKLKELEDNSVDSIVTDPPYGLEFMGKEWDKFATGRSAKYKKGGDINEVSIPGTGFTKLPGYTQRPAKRCKICGKQAWSGSPCKCEQPEWELDNSVLLSFQEFNYQWAKECLRVLKPGGHLLAFGGTRTYHRMAVAIEDAGFEVRDMIEWVYGSGFPKSLNIGKAVDKLQGNERVITGSEQKAKPTFHSQNVGGEITEIDNIKITKGTSEWEGWGTALKPSHEPIVWATKSLTNTNQFAILEDINNNLISTIWQSLENLQKQDISKLQETVLIHLNTALLWQNILAELLKNESKFTTLTVSKMTTELKILNSLLLKNTQDDTDGKSQTYQNGTQGSQVNGLDLLVGIVESCLAGEKKNIADIQTLIAQGLATYKQNRIGMIVKNAEQDLLPIILNANSALISVLTDIITELSQNELNTFVNFAEKSLKQYLAEPQSIADENVWQEHIQKALPNHNPICMARKPLSEKSVASNCLKWGTGGINIDESRVEYQGDADKASATPQGKCTSNIAKGGRPDVNDEGRLDFERPEQIGRFPSNLIHDNSEEVRECFPDTKGGAYLNERGKSSIGFASGKLSGDQPAHQMGDYGNASRFFKSIIYQAKASKSERNMGCEELENNKYGTNITPKEGSILKYGYEEAKRIMEEKCVNKNNHPTVKPIALMEYLIKMTTPKGGVVLDPFAGSGSTLVAAKKNGYQYIGIELTEEYIPIIEARLSAVKEELKLF